jgi:hypothetical protein
MLRCRSPRGTTILSVLAGLAFVALGVLAVPSAGAAEEFEAVNCYAGTSTAFHGSQELQPFGAYTLNGILRSSYKPLDNAATRCEGVYRGGEGYGFCKVVDTDGDIIVYGGPHAGTKFPLTLREGTGKWKGITGAIESERIAAAAKPAVPGSFHHCTQWKRKIEVRK